MRVFAVRHLTVTVVETRWFVFSLYSLDLTCLASLNLRSNIHNITASFQMLIDVFTFNTGQRNVHLLARVQMAL